MLREHHYDGKFFWPEGFRTAVVLTLDFQGGEDVRPLKDGTMDHEEWTQCEYGPHTGIWRILRILAEEKVKITFNTCGGIAERFPEAVKAIVDQGHEIAGHGYHHECARELTREEERDVMKRTGDPHDTLVIWKSMFDEFYAESKSTATYVPFQVHDYISGRPGRAQALRSIIQHMKKEGVCITTATDVARWTRDHVFKLGGAEAAPRK